MRRKTFKLDISANFTAGNKLTAVRHFVGEFKEENVENVWYRFILKEARRLGIADEPKMPWEE